MVEPSHLEIRVSDCPAPQCIFNIGLTGGKQLCRALAVAQLVHNAWRRTGFWHGGSRAWLGDKWDMKVSGVVRVTESLQAGCCRHVWDLGWFLYRELASTHNTTPKKLARHLQNFESNRKSEAAISRTFA